MRETLEQSLEKIETTKEKLKQVMIEIDEYSEPNDDIVEDRKYRKNLNKRENLTINLNYFQNQVLIEQNNEIIKYLKESKK
jgi:hypothetical protein